MLVTTPSTEVVKAYNPNEPRDDHGRWSATGGGGASNANRSQQHATVQRARKIVADVTNQLGVSADNIVIAHGFSKTNPKSVAEYNLKTGRVILHVAQEAWQKSDSSVLEGVVVHELAHKKVHDWLKTNGKVRTLRAAAALYGVDLTKDPQISAYASKWFKLAQENKHTDWQEHMIHEQLAEISREMHRGTQGGFNTLPEGWRRLYSAIVRKPA